MDDVVTGAVAALVARRWPGAALMALDHLAGDFSARRYLRARLGGAAPPTVVAMVLAGSGLPLSSEELCIFPEPLKELPFLDVHRLLAAVGAAVPAIYAHDLAAGVLLLEDGGDAVLWDRVVAEPAAAEERYRSALDALLVLHTRGSASPDRTSIAFTQRFDARLYQWELDHFLEWGVERRLGIAGEDARAPFARGFATLVDELAALSEPELVLSHRDYHSWNILMPGDAPLIIDFQDALLAPPEYDLASLFTDRITPRVVTPAMAARLRDYYWRGRSRVEDEAARRRYTLIALQRALKVVGRLHYIALAKGKHAPLAFLPDVLATTRHYLAQAALPGLAAAFDALPWPAEETATR
ncbi:MAG TPA: phosphotransferase [Candidatus Binatia bacterium]|jgi:hypothetical protein